MPALEESQACRCLRLHSYACLRGSEPTEGRGDIRLHENQQSTITHHRQIQARVIMLLVTTPRFEPRSIGGRAQSLAHMCAEGWMLGGAATGGSRFKSLCCHQQHYGSGFNQPMVGIDVGWLSCITPAFSGLNASKTCRTV